MNPEPKPCPLCGKPIEGEALTELVEIEPARFALCRLHAECSKRRKNGAMHPPPPEIEPGYDSEEE